MGVAYLDKMELEVLGGEYSDVNGALSMALLIIAHENIQVDFKT